MKYYCDDLKPDDLRWELSVVRDQLRKEPDSREYRERLAELSAMPAQTVKGDACR